MCAAGVGLGLPVYAPLGAGVLGWDSSRRPAPPGGAVAWGCTPACRGWVLCQFSLVVTSCRTAVP